MIDTSVELLLHGTQYKQLLSGRILALREQYGLRKIDVEVLYYLYCFRDQNTSGDLCRTHLFTKGHISQSVERLQELDLLVCIPDSQDRRRIHFQLTARALQIAGRISKVREEMAALIFEGVTEEERRVLRRVAERITQNMEQAVQNDKR